MLKSTTAEQDPARPTFFSELLAVLVFFAFSAGFLIAATFFNATVFFFSGAASLAFFVVAAGAVFVLGVGFLAGGALAFVFALVAGAAAALAFAAFFSTGFFGTLGFLAGPSDSSLELTGLLF